MVLFLGSWKRYNHMYCNWFIKMKKLLDRFSSILVIIWPINWPCTAIKFFSIPCPNYNLYNVLFFHCRMFFLYEVNWSWKKKFFCSVHTELKGSWMFNKSLQIPWISQTWIWQKLKSKFNEDEKIKGLCHTICYLLGVANGKILDLPRRRDPS